MAIRLHHNLIVYFLVISLDSISYGLIAPILAPLLAHPTVFFTTQHTLLSQYGLYGLMIALFPLSYMLSAPFLGQWSDAQGRKSVLLFCLILTIVSFLGYGLAFYYQSIGLFMFSRVVGGISAGSQGVAQAAVIDIASRQQKPVVISTIAIGMTMGLIIGPLVASWWSPTLSWLPFMIIIAPCLLAIYLLFKYITGDRPTKNKAFSFTSWLLLLKEAQVRKVLFLFFLFELGWSLYYQTIPLFFSLYGLSHPQVSLISAYVGSLLALGLFVGMRIALRYISLSSLLTMSFVMGAFALMINIMYTSLLLFLLSAIPIVVAVAFIYPGIISQLSELVNSEQQGLLMGMTDSILALAFTVTGMLSSLLIYVHPALPFIVAASCWVIAGVGCLRYQHHDVCTVNAE